MCALEKGPSEIGPHGGVTVEEVRLAPGSPTSVTTLDREFMGDDSRSVLDADDSKPGVGDSSSCHNDVTLVQHRGETSPDPAEGMEAASAEGSDRTLEIARGETVFRTAKLLQASELAHRVEDIGHLTRVVASQVMRVMRPWLIQQADVATTPNRFTAELRRRIDHYVEQAIIQLLARLAR